MVRDAPKRLFTATDKGQKVPGYAAILQPCPLVPCVAGGCKQGEAGGSVVKIALIFIVISLFPSPLSAKREHPEKWYQQKWCEEHSGRLEVVLPDGYPCGGI
jgi:hypothetical protein